MATELYKRYRPTTLKELIGQDSAVSMLDKMTTKNSIPQTILLTGPSGCGKTTIARILRDRLKCTRSDFQEINCANEKGIEKVRWVEQRMALSPMGGKDKKKVYMWDECHQWTSPAQDAALKMLEDTPSHVHFILCTTHPQDLKKTIRTRCTEIVVKALSPKEMGKLLHYVCEQEGAEISEDVIDAIINNSGGSPRQALVSLNGILHLDDEDEQLQLIKNGTAEAEAIELARALIKPKNSWGTIVKILKKLEEEPESLRYLVLGYASSVLLGGGGLAKQAAKVIECFQDNFYESKRAGLILACYNVVHA